MRMTGTKKELERAAIARLCTATAAAVLIFVLLAGCGSEGGAVRGYLDMAGKISRSLSAAAGDLTEYWSLTTSEQTGVRDALARFRKALSGGQDRLDRVDAPRPCMELESRIGTYLDIGRETADLSTPFADYMGSLSSRAALAAEIVAGVQDLESENYVASGLSRLSYKAQGLLRDLQTIIVPGGYGEIHEDFRSFVEFLVAELDRAYEQYRDVPPVTEEETEEGTVPPRKTRKDSRLQRLSSRVSYEWGAVNEVIVTRLDGIRTANGLKDKQVALDRLTQEIDRKIKALAEEYR